MAYLEQMRGKMAQVRAGSGPTALPFALMMTLHLAPWLRWPRCDGPRRPLPAHRARLAQMGQAAQVAEMNAGLAQNLQERM